MKKIILILLMLSFSILFCSNDEDENLTKTSNLPNYDNPNIGQSYVSLKSVDIISQDVSIAVGYDFVYYKSGNYEKHFLALFVQDGSTTKADIPLNGTKSYLVDVSVLSQSDIWVIGNSDNSEENPYLFNYNGSTWNQINIPSVNTNVVFNSIFMLDASNGYIAGYDKSLNKGIVYKYDGTQWNNLPLLDYTYPWKLKDVYAISPSDVWACGETEETGEQMYTGLILHYNGNTWERKALSNTCFSYTLRKLSFDNQIFCVGGDSCYQFIDFNGGKGVVLTYNGTDWTNIYSPAVPSVYGLYSISSGLYNKTPSTWSVGFVLGETSSDGLLINVKDSWSTPAFYYTNYPLYDIDYKNENSGFIAGFNSLFHIVNNEWYVIDISQYIKTE